MDMDLPMSFRRIALPSGIFKSMDSLDLDATFFTSLFELASSLFSSARRIDEAEFSSNRALAAIVSRSSFNFLLLGVCGDAGLWTGTEI
jgi:hypothetical protein